MGKPPITPEPRRWLAPTIEPIIVLIAALVGCLALSQLALGVYGFTVHALVSFLLMVFAAVLLHGLVFLRIPGRCPGCARWTLRRLARAPSYFRCAGCGARFKRRGFGPLHDASGPDDDAVFRGKARAHRWLGFLPAPKDDTTTVGRLLGGYRRRRSTRARPESVKFPFIGWRFRSAPGDRVPAPRNPAETLNVLLRSHRRRHGPRDDSSRETR
jgi:hypothetical protein